MALDPKMTWFSASKILSEHKSLKYKQVYCWILSNDHKLVLVSKDGNKWQFPGGHPEVGETVLETCYREVEEEAGIKLRDMHVEPKFFGYYVVQEFNPDTDEVIDEYLQLRLFVTLNQSSIDLPLMVNEREDEERKIHHVKWYTFEEAGQGIFWFNGSKELSSFKQAINLE